MRFRNYGDFTTFRVLLVIAILSLIGMLFCLRVEAQRQVFGWSTTPNQQPPQRAVALFKYDNPNNRWSGGITASSHTPVPAGITEVDFQIRINSDPQQVVHDISFIDVYVPAPATIVSMKYHKCRGPRHFTGYIAYKPWKQSGEHNVYFIHYEPIRALGPTIDGCTVGTALHVNVKLSAGLPAGSTFKITEEGQGGTVREHGYETLGASIGNPQPQRPQYHPMDLDKDGQLDEGDIVVWLSKKRDLNGDKRIDNDDLLKLIRAINPNMPAAPRKPRTARKITTTWGALKKARR